MEWSVAVRPPRGQALGRLQLGPNQKVSNGQGCSWLFWAMKCWDTTGVCLRSLQRRKCIKPWYPRKHLSLPGPQFPLQDRGSKTEDAQHLCTAHFRHPARRPVLTKVTVGRSEVVGGPEFPHILGLPISATSSQGLCFIEYFLCAGMIQARASIKHH